MLAVILTLTRVPDLLVTSQYFDPSHREVLQETNKMKNVSLRVIQAITYCVSQENVFQYFEHDLSYRNALSSAI